MRIFCKNSKGPQIDIIMDWKVIFKKPKLRSEVSLFKNPSNIEWQFWPMPSLMQKLLINKSQWLNYAFGCKLCFSTQRGISRQIFSSLSVQKTAYCTFWSYSKYISIWSHHLWCLTFNRVFEIIFMALKLPGEIYWLNNPIQHFPSCGTVPRTRQISEYELLQFGSTVETLFSITWMVEISWVWNHSIYSVAPVKETIKSDQNWILE